MYDFCMNHGNYMYLPNHNIFRLSPIESICKQQIKNDLPFNSMTNDKILALNLFADNKIIVTQKMKFVLGRVENIVEKGENTGYQHFLLFPQCFLFPGVSRDCVVMG